MATRTTWETGPPRAVMIARPRVVRALEDASTRPVVLLEAPAGYGKTLAVQHWLGGRDDGARQGWVDLRSVAGRPRAFVEELRRGLGLEIGAPGAAARPDRVVDDLLDELLDARVGAVLVVLDGLEVVEPPLMPYVRRLAEHLPADWQLVITTRAAPDVGLARLRAALSVAEVGPDVLAFDAEEATTLLRGRVGLDVGDEVIEDIVERFDGWPALLGVAGLYAQAHPAPEEALRQVTARHPWIDAYLRTEVLANWDDELRRFVVRTAPLARLSPDLCDAVTGTRTSRGHLDVIGRWRTSRLTYDDAGAWISHDATFRDWLLSLAERESMEEVRAVRAMAAQWCRDRGLVVEAVTYALAAGEVDLAVDLLSTHAYTFVPHGPRRMLDLLDGLPEAALVATPELRLIQADAAAARGQGIRASRLLDRVQDTCPEVDIDRDAGLRRGVALLAAEWHLRDGHVGLAARLLPDLRVPLPARPEGVAMHAGWDGVRVAFLRDLLTYLAQGVPDQVSSSAVRALVAHHAMDRATAQWLARLAAAEDDVALDPAHRMVAAAALAWTGTPTDALRAQGIAATVAAGVGSWWLTDLLREGIDVEVARRSNQWRRASQHMDAARRLLEDVPDPGAAVSCLLPREPEPVDDDGAGAAVLSDRELLVLRHLVGRRSRREIATELHVSQNTIKTQLRAAYRKLGVDSRQEAIERAHALGLLDGTGDVPEDERLTPDG